MGRAARLVVALLLTGFPLVVLPAEGWAENTPWNLENFGERTSQDQPYVVISLHQDGSTIGVYCAPGKPKSEFAAGFVVERDDFSFPDGDVAVSWKVDERVSHVEIWRGRTLGNFSGIFSLGQQAYDMALAIIHAQKQITLENLRGTIMFDVDGANDQISILLLLCGLPDQTPR